MLKGPLSGAEPRVHAVPRCRCHACGGVQTAGKQQYGKLIEALECQTNVLNTKDEKVVDRALQGVYFNDLDEDELESWKPRITLSRPFQIGIAVYQLAKLRMLEFYDDFLDGYFNRRDFELIQMDTDSNYMTISSERLEDIVEAAANPGSSRSSVKAAG